MCKRSFVALPILLFALSSCSNSTNSSANNGGYLNTVVTSTRTSPSSLLLEGRGVAQFTTQSGGYLTVDSVLLNGFDLPYTGELNGYVVDTNLLFDSLFEWRVVGSGSIPSFTQSVTSPGFLVVSSPGYEDTIYKLQTATVTWSGSTPGSTVYIQLQDRAGNIWPTELQQAAGTGNNSFPDNGSAVITTSDLSGLTPGPLVLTVYRQNLSNSTLGNESFSFSCLSESVVPINLKQ